jgi:hypothetical protein
LETASVREEHLYINEHRRQWLEQILSIWSRFCFADGETTHAEGGEADAFASDEAA